jgi:hypothetical protein
LPRLPRLPTAQIYGLEGELFESVIVLGKSPNKRRLRSRIVGTELPRKRGHFHIVTATDGGI